MKKIFTLILMCIMMFVLAACQNAADSSEKTQTPETIAKEEATMTKKSETMPEETTGGTKKELIVYFSWSGNTESVAKEIEKQTGADVFRIVPTEAYTDDYDTLLDIAQKEQQSGARPAISGSIKNFDSYEIVYLGFPNWWGDMPMILYSFLDDYDLSGKTIVPFVTSGGSGFSNTISTIENMEPNALVLDGLSLLNSQTDAPHDAVADWLSGLGL